ncbi:SMC-Scp complex subunit ScpB [Siminovitchia sediminis]|uniref:Segregation and condensation protein B n=1 Tax=Siminovitchia sediminis TaxID=1274353 RepID=A0ABW4KJY8_9BACI
MKAVNHKAALESLLFAAGDEGLTLKQIGLVLEVSEKEAEQLIEALLNDYESDDSRGLTIEPLAGTYQLVTKRNCSDVLKKMVQNPQAHSISQAALETLAIIAYKQPITRIEIEEIRGVNTDRPLRTLLSKGLIREAGRRQGIGRAILYATTREFLDHFGLTDLKELPPLPEPVTEKTALKGAGPLFDIK